MSLDSARNYLKKFNLEDRIVKHENLISTVKLAAEQIGCEEAQIAKSLTFKVDDNPVLIVLTGDKKVDNKKFKDYFNTKAKMLKADEVEELIGHEVGGVCPFGVNEDVKIYLDISLKDFNVVYPAGGSLDTSVKIEVDELENILNYLDWVDIGK